MVDFYSRNKERKEKPDQDESTQIKTSTLEEEVHIREFSSEEARSECTRLGPQVTQKGWVLEGAELPNNGYMNLKFF